MIKQTIDKLLHCIKTIVPLITITNLAASFHTTTKKLNIPSYHNSKKKQPFQVHYKIQNVNTRYFINICFPNR